MAPQGSWARAAAIIAFVALTPCLAAHAADTPQPLNVDAYLHRPNLLVTDLDRALTLYRDVLGFTAHAIIDSPPGSYSYAIYDLPPEAKLRFMFLSTASQQRVLALTEVKGVSLPPTRRPYEGATIIEVKGDLAPILVKVKMLGLAVDAPVALTAPSGQTRTDVAVTDFDGHRLVLFKIDQ
ncbi:MAG: VOC family protein [Rhodobacteraceae bacterium]|nr:VOC family protein [Paracoccaceae bacterium]